jgi:hypothetical protein
MILEMQNPYYPCNIRHCQSIAIEWQGQRGVIVIYPALFVRREFCRKAKFLLPLISKLTQAHAHSIFWAKRCLPTGVDRGVYLHPQAYACGITI